MVDRSDAVGILAVQIAGAPLLAERREGNARRLAERLHIAAAERTDCGRYGQPGALVTRLCCHRQQLLDLGEVACLTQANGHLRHRLASRSRLDLI